MDDGGLQKVFSTRTLNHFAVWNLPIQGFDFDLICKKNLQFLPRLQYSTEYHLCLFWRTLVALNASVVTVHSETSLPHLYNIAITEREGPVEEGALLSHWQLMHLVSWTCNAHSFATSCGNSCTLKDNQSCDKLIGFPKLHSVHVDGSTLWYSVFYNRLVCSCCPNSPSRIWPI